MAISKLSKRDRLHQIHRWLQYRHPSKNTTRLRVCGIMPVGFKDCEGAVWFDNRSPLIRLNDKMSRSNLIYTLIHEYAHVLVYDRAPNAHESLDHSDRFYRCLGVLERSWHDDGYVISGDF